MEVFYQLLPSIFDSMGGTNLNGVGFVFKMNDLSIEVQRAYWPLILKLIDVVKKNQEKKSSNSNLVDARGKKIK